MAQTPQEFFSKNMKWFALAFFILFLFKSIQSCNRSMTYNVKDKGTKYLIDSLQKDNTDLRDSIKTLHWTNKMLKSTAESERAKADAIQSVAEKVKTNTTTTVNVRGNVDRDSIKNK